MSSVDTQVEVQATDPVKEVSPYLSARIHWNAHVGAVLSAARLWQIVALVSLSIALIAAGGAI